MCCFLTALLFVGPRLAILVGYLIRPVYVNAAFDSFFWGLLGFIFLPWTTLMYIGLYPGGIESFDWIILGIGVFADIASWMGNYANKNRVPGGDSLPSLSELEEMSGAGSGSGTGDM